MQARPFCAQAISVRRNVSPRQLDEFVGLVRLRDEPTNLKSPPDRDDICGSPGGCEASPRIRCIVAMQWFWSYLTYRRGARLIAGAEGEG